MPVAEDLDVLVEDVLERAAADGGELRVHVLRAAIEVGDDDGNGRLFDGAGETVELFLGEALAGDIAADGADRDDGAAFVTQTSLFPSEPTNALRGPPTVLGDGAMWRTREVGERGGKQGGGV